MPLPPRGPVHPGEFACIACGCWIPVNRGGVCDACTPAYLAKASPAELPAELPLPVCITLSMAEGGRVNFTLRLPPTPEWTHVLSKRDITVLLTVRGEDVTATLLEGT